MARFGREFVRRVVAKCKGVMGRDVEARREQTVEEEAEMGWDNPTNEEWNLSTEQHTSTGWNSTFQPLPEEVDVIRKSDSRDSGYASFGDTPSKQLRKASPIPDDINAIKWLQLPFTTKHYFLTYVQRILEATCLRYARENLRGCLTDLEWKKLHLLFPSPEYPPDRLVYRDWLGEDEIELCFWLITFAQRVRMPKNQRIFESTHDLRNATVHRGDREELDFEALSYAMKFPALLGDAKGKSDITNAFRYTMEDPTLDDETKTRVEDAMFTPQPCTTHHQVLARIQSMLEETCFDNAARKIPHVLTKNAWYTPEQIEFQNWHDTFRDAGIQNDDSAADIWPGINPSCLLDLLWSARIHIRITVAHHLPLSDEYLIEQVHRAINIAILQGDWPQALEVEVLAEMYFANRSRAQVLERLEAVYRDGRIGSPYERRRRVAIAEFLEEEMGCTTVGEDEAEVVPDTWDVDGLGFGKKWVVRTWSPSMWEGLKRVDVL